LIAEFATVLFLLFMLFLTFVLPHPDEALPETAPKLSALESALPLVPVQEDVQEPVPTRRVYRKVVDGEVVYEGDVLPAEALVGPPPIERSGNEAPSVGELSSSVQTWLRDLIAVPIEFGDLATNHERMQMARAHEIRFVDDRMLVVLQFRGEPLKGDLTDRLVECYCELVHCLNRTEKTYSPEAMVTLMEVPLVAEIDDEIRAMKQELRSLGHSFRLSTAPVSLETVHALGGDRR
jgi:hypothetical protein